MIAPLLNVFGCDDCCISSRLFDLGSVGCFFTWSNRANRPNLSLLTYLFDSLSGNKVPLRAVFFDWKTTLGGSSPWISKGNVIVVD